MLVLMKILHKGYSVHSPTRCERGEPATVGAWKVKPLGEVVIEDREALAKALLEQFEGALDTPRGRGK